MRGNISKIQKFLLIASLLLLIFESQIIPSLGIGISRSISSGGKIKFSYIISKDNNLIKAKNIWTGNVDFQSTDAVDVMTKVISRLNGGGGGILLVNSSLYLSRQVVLENVSNIKITGHGAKIVKTAGIMFRIVNVSNLVFEGLHFHSLTNDAYTAIRFEGENNGITIRKCQFTRELGAKGSVADLIFFDQSGLTKELLIEDSYLENAQIDAIAIKNVINGVIENNTIIDASTEYNSTASGITIEKSSGLIVRKNYFKRTGNYDMAAVNVFGNSSDIIIEDNDILNMGRLAINIYEAKNISVINNRMINIHTGIRIEKTSEVLIMGNNFEAVSLVDTKAVFVTTSNNIIIIKNGINATQSGLIILNSNNITIEQNSVHCAAKTFIAEKFGVLLHNSSNAKVINNTITRANSFGLAVHISPKTIVVSNIVAENMLSGIRLWRSNDSLVSNNTVRNNGQYSEITYDRNGIDLVDSTNCTVKENKVFDDQSTKTQLYGLVEVGSSDYNVIVNNDFRNNGLGGMRIIGSNTVIQDNLT